MPTPKRWKRVVWWLLIIWGSLWGLANVAQVPLVLAYSDYEGPSILGGLFKALVFLTWGGLWVRQNRQTDH
jgi:hypothetical protein